MKKLLSFLLVAVMLFTMVPASVFASDGITVKLVSFMRGDVSPLRSSELLEVQVEGYEGNPRELTYKWTSSLGTYLYIYNSHNMYGINNTYGEYEIYNTSENVNRSSNVEADRAGDKTLTKEGFMWASVYGAYSKSSALRGTVTVEVFDKNGKSLGSDSCSNFTAHNLDADIDNVVIGLFEEEEVNALDLLGRSGVVHITCTASTVTKASLKQGSNKNVIQIDNRYGDYYITGKSAGQVQINLSIKKENCKFHKNTSGTAEPIVYVFKKPTTTTTTTTLTLNKDSIDNRCEYFIDGNKGNKQPDGTILFTGLTPNTNYTVEVRAEYDDNGTTKYVYAYVDDTTKPVYKATVKTYLDDTLTDIADIHGEDVTLYLHEDKEGAEYITLKNEGTGVYTAEVTNGVYFPWHIEADNHYHKAKEFKLIIENANGELNLHHYSVTYNANEGAFTDGEAALKEIYPSASAVSAIDSIPVREGYIFTGWEYDGKTYNAGDEIVSSLSAPITLTAKWEKAVNVTINVTINHKTENGFDPNSTRADLDVDFLEKTSSSPAFVETGDKLHFRTDKVTDEKGNKKDYTCTVSDDVTTYTVNEDCYTYTGLLESSTFGVALSKSGYDVGTIVKKQDKLGNWVINIPLTYNPDDFDLDFSIEMADDVPEELYPDAVIVKVAYWNTETNEWKIISQHETKGAVVKPGVRVDIDPITGEGSGSYPVWRFDGNKEPYGYRAVVTGFIYKDSTIVVPTEKDHIKDDNTVIVTYTDGNYTATMDDIADGKKFSTSLNGAYYNDSTKAQQGTLHGVISVEKYDVTFDAKGGTVNGKATDVALQKYRVPSFADYQPTKDGHNFLGWYTEDGEKAMEGELLTEDIILYAKWDKNLTGTLIVDGYYIDESGTQHRVDDVDRATHALVELEEIFDGHTYDIAGQTVKVEWADGDHTSKPVSYEFKGLDPDKTYRISVYLMNYEALYQNSVTNSNNNGDIHDDYNKNDYTAVYPEKELTTFVNTFLHFEPEEYVQNVIIDASSLGESLRPENALVKYYSEEVGVDDAYVLITQHKGEDEGVKVKLDTKTGKNDGVYGDKVWKKNFNGNLYDYQASLVTLDGKNIAELPVDVIYGNTVRWSPYNQAPTGTLQVKIIPNRYGIIYNENYEDEGVKVVSYGTHIWSYKTVIDYVSVREGYVFEGWYSNPECTGDKVTEIAETVANDTELYAKWKKGNYSYTVNYLEEGTDKVLAAAKTGEAAFEDAVTENAIVINDYTLVDDESKTISIKTENNVINFYYAADSYGGGEDGDDGDGTPDKYQKKVIFRVVNGTWSDGTDADKVVYLDLKKDGEYAVDGTAYITAPKNMKANEGFKNGAWDIIPPVYVSGTATEVYTFTYQRGTTPLEQTDVKYIVEHYRENADGTYSLVAGDTEILIGKIGSTVTASTKAYERYCYNSVKSEATSRGVLKVISSAGDILTLKLYYDVDTVGGGEDGDEGDSTPDTYQKKIIFKIVNGKWADGTTADKFVYLNLMKDGRYAVDGTASLTAPTGMIANEDFEGGTWDVTPPSVVRGTNTETYIYRFEELHPGYVVEIPDRVTVYEEDSTEIKVEIIPEEGTDKSEIPEVESYKSTDETIAIVDQNGKVTGVNEGTTTVIVTFTDGTQKTVTVVVKEREGIHVVFGKTDGIGWYRVSRDGGKTFETVFGNSTLEVKQGTQLIIKAGDIMGDSFTFYVNGDAVKPNDNGELIVTVKSYMLIGAIGIDPDIDFEVPDVEESLNWFQKIIKAIKDFFKMLFGIK